MARWTYGSGGRAPTAGERVLGCLQAMWEGYKQGELLIAPQDIDPLLPCDCVHVIPELVVEDEFGWTLHLNHEIVRYDWSREPPFQLMSHELWAEYQDVLDELRKFED